jgi:hypothetical protein
MLNVVILGVVMLNVVAPACFLVSRCRLIDTLVHVWVIYR